MILKELDCDLYGAHIYFMVGDWKKAKAWLKRRCGYTSDLSAGIAGQVHEFKNDDTGVTQFYLYLKNGRDLRTIVHEVFHLCDFILEHCGIDTRGEVMAFYLDHWFGRVTDIIASEDSK